MDEYGNAYACIPIKFPLSYRLNPMRNTLVAIARNSNVNPVNAPNKGHAKCVSNCNGMNEMNPAGKSVNSRIRTAP